MKKSSLLIALSSTLFVSMTHAQLDKWPGNFLVGISGGFEKVFGQTETIMDYNSSLLPISNTDFIRGNMDRGFIGGILAGYQTGFDGWIFGGEVSVEWQDFNQDQDFAFSDAAGLIGWNANAKYDQHTIIGVTTRIGYQYANCPYLIPYIRLGVETYNESYRVTFDGNPAVYPANFAIENNQRSYRFLGGIGLELPRPKCPRFSVRAEYNYHAATGGIEAQQGYNDPLPLQVAVNPAFFSDYKTQAHSVKLSFILNAI